MLSCTSDRKPCCGPKMRADRDARRVHQRVDDVREVRVDRRRIGDDADPAAAQPAGGEQACGAEGDGHRRIIVAARR